MTFIWPSMLLTLLIVPIIVSLYLRVQRRRLALAAGFSAFGGPPASERAPGAGSSPGVRRAPGFRRQLPPLLFLLSLVIILVALARPQAQISVPRIEGTVMLVIDVSGSMAATDADPSRLEAAKKVAREFVLSQPATVQIGIVSFSSSGFTVQAPTNDTNSLLNTIARLEPTSGTSLGLGILTALNSIAVDAGLAPAEPTPGASASTPSAGDAGQPGGQGAAPAAQRDQALLAQLPEGRYPAAVIVLLSDGEQNESLDPRRAADAAAEHGVRVDALGFGTPGGVDLDIDGYRVHTSLDEATLQAVTQAAGGTYYATQREENMPQVYASLRPELVVKPEAMEVTAVFAGAGAVIMLAGSLLSMLWFNRLV
jgi:Ca-activated chloride channel homolog